MVVVDCPLAGCNYRTADQEPSIVSALLQLHDREHQPTSSGNPARGPKLPRPSVCTGIDVESWNSFVRLWEAYRDGSGIDDRYAGIQLFQCASDELKNLLLKSDRTVATKPADDVIRAMRKLCVIPVSRGVVRAELMRMRQKNDESFRLFAARVRGKAETCDFVSVVRCTCGLNVNDDYTEEAIRDVLLAGIDDSEIRREALSTEGLQRESVNNLISFVEGHEMASRAVTLQSKAVLSFSEQPNSPSSFSALSSFKRCSREDGKPKPDDANKARTSVCPDCNRQYALYKRGRNGWNRKPFKNCLECWLVASGKSPNAAKSSVTALCAAQISTLNTLEKIGHQVYDDGSWRKAKFRNHPMLLFQLSTEDRQVTTEIQAIADTGAQSNLWGYNDFLSAGFDRSVLIPVKSHFYAADKNPIRVVGAFGGIFEGRSADGHDLACRAMVYVSDCVTGFFLSCDTMMDLRVIEPKFPRIGGCGPHLINSRRSDDKSCRAPVPSVGTLYGHHEESCECPQRSAVPDRPLELPFEPLPKNIEKMRSWLLNRYASSTFNVCPHRPLQQMAGPPVEIHLDESARPKACHSAAPVPLHWQQRVKEDLIRDKALGVIEKVPYGVPTRWCHRMVVTRKNDGTPRRTVDLSPLNKYCRRETFSGESPFVLARRVAGNTWKTVSDAWNGYHSVPLRVSDRHLTTFITPFGRYRYTRAPQGFLSSGDGYNRRFAEVLADFQRSERCVDDTIYYDEDLKCHWWRTIDFLSLVGAAGIVLNPAKFQFCQRAVNFAGFQISERSIEPLPKYLEAIRLFPTPQSTTDIRSWFGLVNQVANYAQLRDMMAPFRPFLSPRTKFRWDPQLQIAFERSKESIVEAIREGVRIFEVNRRTCLRPDWSQRGIGYFLLQKYCSCPSDLPDCCPNGWQITLAGSRFLVAAEQRYAAIEGEALAIAWGLENTRYFTQGCNDLVVVTDHKPLTKIFGDRTLDEIPNTRLFRLKQRTLPWKFQVAYLPGKTNAAADAASRYPSPGLVSSFAEVVEEENEESLFMNSISGEIEGSFAITWSRLVEETEKDPVLRILAQAIQEEFCNDHPSIAPYMRFKDSLYLGPGVIFYKDRVVVPEALRKSVLINLHSAHQGVSAMESRAHAIVFWPGITPDIQRTREQCYACNKNAPTQAPEPTQLVDPPTAPFQQVFADFFDFAGCHYLVIGDRLSGWSEIYSTPSGTQNSGAKGLVQCLRSFFRTFGVPEEISSDGGPEFAADTTRKFLDQWDVRHRMSSAYYAQSNGRAEVAVKSAKRLLRSNIGPTGSLNTDQFLRAMLQMRNTPDPDCKLSPAEIIFGRTIRDAFTFCNRKETFLNPSVQPHWRDAWSLKEAALRKRFVRWAERYNERTKSLLPLRVGDRCFIQNQVGPHKRRWDRSGLVVEVLPHKQYRVKVDGSGRLTTRNRRFLRLFKNASSTVSGANTKVQPFVPGESSTAKSPEEYHLMGAEHYEQQPPCDGNDAERPEEAPEEVQSGEGTEIGIAVPTPEPRKPALALRRLLDHNSPGLRELEDQEVTTRLRPR